MCRKCGVEALPPPTPEDFLPKQPARVQFNNFSPPQQVAVNEGEVTKWLRQHGFQRYSRLPQFQIMPLKDFFAITTAAKLIDFGVPPNHASLLLTEILKDASQQPPSCTCRSPSTPEEISLPLPKPGPEAVPE